MKVPGHDNRYGFGGPCFPKDCNALYEYSKDIKQDFSLLAEALLINNNIRSNYDALTHREIEQNINYDNNE